MGQRAFFELARSGGLGYSGGMSTKLSAEQLAAVRAWAAAGTDLNSIQKRLAGDYGIHMTFMDVRFLLLDHGIEIAVAPKPTPEKKEEAAPEAPLPDDAPVAGGVEVSLDELQIPGTLLSGKAVFASGIRGAWQIDQTGRFGWSDLSGKPNPEEMQAFQFELQNLLSKM